MRSDPRHLAVIPHHHGGDGDNPPSPGPATPVIPSLARSFSRKLSPFLALPVSVSLAIISLVASTPTRFLSPFALGHRPSRLSRAPAWSLYPLRLSLTRKLADPISTKLHCVSYLHAVASIYSVRNCTLPSPFPFTSPMHPIFHLHMWRGAPPSIPHSPRGNEKKSAVSTVAFRVSA